VSKRILRINSLIKEQISNIFLREFEFPPGVLVTITRVETTLDLTESNVFVSVIPEEKTEEVFQLLNRKLHFVQQKFNRIVNMRPLPKLKFLNEKKTVEAAEVEKILRELKKEKK